jgi:hypothetical protein
MAGQMRRPPVEVALGGLGAGCRRAVGRANCGSRFKRPPCVFCCLGGFLEGVAEDAICRSLRVGSGMNDEPVIRFQLGNPVLDVNGGVAVGVLISNSSNSAEEGGSHLGDQFLFAVKLIGEAVAKDAVQAALMACAVNQFMEQGAVIVRCIYEATADGHVDGIGARPVISAILGGAGQMQGWAVLPSRHDAFAYFVLVDLRRVCGLLDLWKREAVALLHVENCVVAEHEGDALIVVAGFLVVLGVFWKLLVKDNRRSVFTFTDGAFQLLRLFERKPEWGVVLARPKQQNIDAPVGFAGVEVARERPAFEPWNLPRLFPRNHASLEAGNNAVGNGLVDARPVAAGCLLHGSSLAVAVAFSCRARRHVPHMPDATWRTRG